MAVVALGSVFAAALLFYEFARLAAVTRVSHGAVGHRRFRLRLLLAGADLRRSGGCATTRALQSRRGCLRRRGALSCTGRVVVVLAKPPCVTRRAARGVLLTCSVLRERTRALHVCAHLRGATRLRTRASEKYYKQDVHIQPMQLWTLLRDLSLSMLNIMSIYEALADEEKKERPIQFRPWRSSRYS